VARGAAVTTITYIVVAVVGEVVCPTVVTDTDRDLPGRRSVSLQPSVCMREGGDSDCGYLTLAVVVALSPSMGTGGLVMGGSGVGQWRRG